MFAPWPAGAINYICNFVKKKVPKKWPTTIFATEFIIIIKEV